jgi:hypothetical protein
VKDSRIIGLPCFLHGKNVEKQNVVNRNVANCNVVNRVMRRQGASKTAF